MPLTNKYLCIFHRLLKILFEHFPTIHDYADDGPDDCFFLPLEDGISGQQFYISALYEVLRVENALTIMRLKSGAGFQHWGSLKCIGVGAVRYDHKHANQRWVFFGSFAKSIDQKLPFLPADLIAGVCNGEKIKLPAWLRKSREQDIPNLKHRLSCCISEQSKFTEVYSPAIHFPVSASIASNNAVDDLSPHKKNAEIQSPTTENQKIDGLVGTTQILSPPVRKSNVNFVSPVAMNVLCKGLKRSVADFADISDANTGICIKFFGFNKRRKVWISNDCFEYVDIEGKRQCSNCKRANELIRPNKKYGIVCIKKDEQHSSNLLPSTDSLSSYIIIHYKKFDDDNLFLSDESTLLHARVLYSIGDKELKLCFLHSDKTTNLKDMHVPLLLILTRL